LKHLETEPKLPRFSQVFISPFILDDYKQNNNKTAMLFTFSLAAITSASFLSVDIF
jgi:hypothetical protein